MAASLILLPAIFSYLIVLSQSSSSSSIAQIGTETSCTNQHNHHLICDFEDAKLKIARLEAILEETIQNINAKSLYLEESRKLIDEMTHEMDRLQSAVSSLKGESSRTNERLNQLEEEIRLLWATLRKTNFELHFLESKAQDAENRLELASSKVETMAAIITEQWIQIQQLEQALHIAEMRALKVKRQTRSTRCTFLKLFRNLFGNHLQKFMEMLDSFLFDKESAFGSYLSRVMHQLEKILSATKKYHHELQGFVKQEMEKNEFTAALAHKEVVFFVASALITFPIMSAWMLLSSQFS
ncbi:uncharacterized protein LOC114299150 isoform X2 [Camellia sinensis]|uniref:uncharacterized protein LOC114299150 isoform X2 n=1 Tax=Camellia sinensis TaxID=4442 RepID=UPI001036B974|nr:uncharacterized protein LOC114299150 isoform X2 [Camellia sinensis]